MCYHYKKSGYRKSDYWELEINQSKRSKSYRLKSKKEELSNANIQIEEIQLVITFMDTGYDPDCESNSTVSILEYLDDSEIKICTILLEVTCLELDYWAYKSQDYSVVSNIHNINKDDCDSIFMSKADISNEDIEENFKIKYVPELELIIELQY